MYLNHFGLQQPPFRITPDTKLFFKGAKREDILQAILYSLQHGQGIIKVIGEVGMGKTMLCRMLAKLLPATTSVAYIAHPTISSDDIIFLIAHELGIDNLERDKFINLQLLHQYLLNRHAQSKRVVILIEEAQTLGNDSLEELRLLSNLETDTEKLLHIVLFAQPELDEKLANYQLRALAERITWQFYLNRVNAEQLFDYLNYRMQAAGYNGKMQFSIALAKQINKAADGLLRRANLIADKSLLACFADNMPCVDKRHVKRAISDCNFKKISFYRRKKLLPFAIQSGRFEA